MEGLSLCHVHTALCRHRFWSDCIAATKTAQLFRAVRTPSKVRIAAAPACMQGAPLHDLGRNLLEDITPAPTLELSPFLHIPIQLADWSALRHLRLTCAPPSMDALPDSIGTLVHLTELKLLQWQCKDLKELPQSAWQLHELRQLHIEQCAELLRLPETISRLTGLTKLRAYVCGKLQGVPDGVCALNNLQALNLTGCKSLIVLPDSISRLMSLTQLVLTDCDQLQKLPQSIVLLKNLSELHLDRCSQLQSLPDAAGSLINLRFLNVAQCYALPGLPQSITQLTSLTHIRLEYRSRPPFQPGCWPALQRLHLAGAPPETDSLADSIGYVERLTALELARWDCKRLEAPSQDGMQLHNLKQLVLEDCSRLQSWLSSRVSSLTRLTCLHIHVCKQVQELPEGLSRLTGLQEVQLHDSKVLQELPSSIMALVSLSKLSLQLCGQLRMLPEGIAALTNLVDLNLYGCKQLTALPKSLGVLAELTALHLEVCIKLRQLPDSIGQLTKLQLLDFRYCNALQKLPESIQHLEGAKLSCCEHLWQPQTASVLEAPSASVGVSAHIDEDARLLQSTKEIIHMPRCVWSQCSFVIRSMF